MKIYKVFDDEWEAIYGIEQLKDFATDQVLNCEDNFLQDNLEAYEDNWEEILKLANKILNERYRIQTLDEVKLVFQVRCFDIEEIEVY